MWKTNVTLRKAKVTRKGVLAELLQAEGKREREHFSVRVTSIFRCGSQAKALAHHRRHGVGWCTATVAPLTLAVKPTFSWVIEGYPEYPESGIPGISS